ncbi:MAG: AMP-binding protein [Burkholderiales bacterium]|nr:AMP-binding protein [Burkholderiales bacterium]
MHCPKCHRELSGAAEAYICCADAALRWHCRSCAKVSEGFAFPHGRCPLCGGELELFEPDPVADSAALAAVRKAFEIELGGQAFYHRAVVSTADPALRELFGRFAAMEREHMDTLASRYHVDMSPVFDAHAVEHAVVFAGIDRRVGDAEDLFRVAIDMEERAAAFFEATAARAAPGSMAERLYRELAAEERDHAQILRTEQALWRAGKPGPLGAAAAPDTGQGAATMNAAQVLLAGHDDARIALVCGDREVTRGALRDEVARAGTRWRARGLRRGDRVAIRLADGIDWVVAYLGVIWAGGVAVGVNPQVPAAEWLKILDAAGFLFILAESGDETPPPWRVQVVTLADWKRDLGEAAPRDAVQMRADDPALWGHSSGTSGHPKAVVLPQRIALEIERIGRETLGLTADDRLYASSKLFFCYPLANALFTGLKLGATVILDPQWPTAKGVAETVAARRPSVLFSVPSLYRNLLKEGLAESLARCGVRLFVSAGESLPPMLREEWKRRTGRTIVNGFGASETLVLVLVDADDGRALCASPGCEVRALDEAQGAAPGRILVRGSTLALGYWNRPDAQAESFRDGGFSPADLFVRRDDGTWMYAGREDSLVKVHGRWVDLVELEQKLAAECPGIGEAAAVAVPDADGVDAIALFFVAQPGVAMPDSLALREHAGRLPPHQRPRWIHPVEAMPRTPTGKLMRRRLKDLHDAFIAADPHDAHH